jgi:hypothetical protein
MIARREELNCVAMAGMNPGLHTGDRSIFVGVDGHLWSCEGEHRHLATAQLFSVVLLWEPAERLTWVGWLTTVGRWSMQFSRAELDDTAFQHWLEALPGWTPSQLSNALADPGMHLVWRRAPN